MIYQTMKQQLITFQTDIICEVVMISKPVDNMTRRIGNLIRVHESGQIDDRVYSRELRALQDEFLSDPEPEPDVRGR